MVKDLIVRKIKSSDSFIIWKLGFIFMLSMHNIIIFFMLFAGNQKFITVLSNIDVSNGTELLS